MEKSPETVLEHEEEGRGLLAPMTVSIDDDGLDENDPRRVEVRQWLSSNPNPTPVQLAQAGLVAPHLPKPWGLDADANHQLLIDDELKRADVRLPINPIGIGWAGPTILYAGTEEQQQRWLPKLLSGEEFWCQLFSEPNAGSDLASLSTRAERDGDEWIVTGQKVWTSYAHLATWGILLARTSNEGAPQKGISYFICPMNAPGVTIRPIIDITGDHAFNEVFLDEVRLPADYLIGNVNDGWRLAKVTLGNERVSLSGEGVLWGRGPTAADLVELVRTSRIAHDALERDELVRCWSHGEILRLRGHEPRQSPRRFGGDARGPRSGRIRRRRRQGVGFRFPLLPGVDDRRRYLGRPAQHHRRASARPAQRASALVATNDAAVPT